MMCRHTMHTLPMHTPCTHIRIHTHARTHKHQEEYVEYSRLGNVIRGQEKAVAKSKYEEDVFINNHSVCIMYCTTLCPSVLPLNSVLRYSDCN